MTTADALQTTLAAEHAAVYVYGVLGAQTSRSSSPELYAALSGAYAEHRARRDVLTRAVTDAGEEPVAAAPAYDLPAGLDRSTVVTRTARDIEDRCAATYAALVASTEGYRRRWAIGALNDAAVRVLAFRGTPEMLPGADEYTDR
ncbi:ferritin-like domain-containing protein [Nocardioides sp. MAHUQ-72]|uniref:ferritin-like domain-containing protein n=1 Tax=unclassified Nocardioides TaxID=2615069 RepID=UPI003617B7BA